MRNIAAWFHKRVENAHISWLSNKKCLWRTHSHTPGMQKAEKRGTKKKAQQPLVRWRRPQPQVTKTQPRLDLFHQKDTLESEFHPGRTRLNRTVKVAPIIRRKIRRNICQLIITPSRIKCLNAIIYLPTTVSLDAQIKQIDFQFYILFNGVK